MLLSFHCPGRVTFARQHPARLFGQTLVKFEHVNTVFDAYCLKQVCGKMFPFGIGAKPKTGSTTPRLYQLRSKNAITLGW
jgi:hypothetical protein